MQSHANRYKRYVVHVLSVFIDFWVCVYVQLFTIFDFGNADFCESKIPSTSEIKTKPDGWKTTPRGQDRNIWEISHREEDILIQEFERRIAFSKQQVYFLQVG